jgi:hypothetical protein
VTSVGPVLVTVEAPRTAKLPAVSRFGAAVCANAGKKAVDPANRTANVAARATNAFVLFVLSMVFSLSVESRRFENSPCQVRSR